MTIENRLYPVTQFINGNEKAFWLTEFPYQSPGYRGFHRYQIIYVIRDGKLAEYHEDMGIGKKWKGTKYINIPSLFEYTVDHLRGLAEEERNEKDRIDFMDLLQLNKVKRA